MADTVLFAVRSRPTSIRVKGERGHAHAPIPTHDRSGGGRRRRRRRRGGAGAEQEHPHRQAGRPRGRHRRCEVPQDVQGGAPADGAGQGGQAAAGGRAHRQDPLVIKPLHEIGKYGGTWRGGFHGPADFWNGYRCCSGPDHLLFWDYTGDKVTPNIAKGYEMQDGGRTLVLHLRRA